MTLYCVISGGQVGADIAGLRAAKRAGIATGGWMPQGWKTLHGECPGYREMYGMKEHASPAYPPRTSANVSDSDATVRLALDFESAGERCTLREIERLRRPYYDVQLEYVTVGYERILGFSRAPKEFASWYLSHEFRVLNVAGNARPDIEARVEQWLYEAFTAYT